MLENYIYLKENWEEIMSKEELIQAIEAMLFVSGKPVDKKILAEILDVDKNEIVEAANDLKQTLIDRKSGIQLIEINGGYQLASLEKYYSQICVLMDNRPKPNLSQAAMEALAIIAYNPKITRAEIERIRGVNSDGVVNKLLEYNLIEEAGKIDAPGKPMTYKITDDFLRMFGYKSVSDMPELPKIKDDDAQISMFEDEMQEEVTELPIVEN